MKHPPLPKDYRHWTVQQREDWVLKNVKPIRHDVSISCYEDGNVMTLKCVCGWEKDLNEDLSLDNAVRLANNHKKKP